MTHLNPFSWPRPLGPPPAHAGHDKRVGMLSGELKVSPQPGGSCVALRLSGHLTPSSVITRVARTHALAHLMYVAAVKQRRHMSSRTTQVLDVSSKNKGRQ